MMFDKSPRYKNKKLLSAAFDKTCIKCGIHDETVVAAHYCGIGQVRLGKGTGSKVHDFCVADLCDRCHSEFDQYKNDNDYERAWEFLLLCMLTLNRRFVEGVIK